LESHRGVFSHVLSGVLQISFTLILDVVGIQPLLRHRVHGLVHRLLLLKSLLLSHSLHMLLLHDKSILFHSRHLAVNIKSAFHRCHRVD
jgi:hypothetical protein